MRNYTQEVLLIMNGFSELIKNFSVVRDYMRDFYIYGLRTRSEFKHKSPRTYDNEKRRIENWLGDLIKFETDANGKRVSISLDSGEISENPLYMAYRSKSFTDNDIQLHFCLLDILNCERQLSVDEINDRLMQFYDKCFETQTVRFKLNEYVREGILTRQKCGKAYKYSRAKTFRISEIKGFTEFLEYRSETMPFGVIGNYILNEYRQKNNLFRFRHNFIVHTLEDDILLKLVLAMHRKQQVEAANIGKKQMKTIVIGIPLKIFVSVKTGRRYAIMYVPSLKRFVSLRLDYIKSVKTLSEYEDFDYYLKKLNENIKFCWGTSFGSNHRKYGGNEQVTITFKIDPHTEKDLLKRLFAEKRTGEITQKSYDTFVYTATVFDTNEMMPWVKSFTGNILSIDGVNKEIINKFYNDMSRIYRIYGGE